MLLKVNLRGKIEPFSIKLSHFQEKLVQKLVQEFLDGLGNCNKKEPLKVEVEKRLSLSEVYMNYENHTPIYYHDWYKNSNLPRQKSQKSLSYYADISSAVFYDWTNHQNLEWSEAVSHYP